MRNPNKLFALFVGMMALFMATPSLAQSYDRGRDYDRDRPFETYQGDVPYRMGGVGLDERETFRSEHRGYNLQIFNANRQRHLVADVNIVIEGRRGRVFLRLDGTDPLVYAKLPPGNYTLRANVGGERQVKRISIKRRGVTKVSLIWRQR